MGRYGERSRSCGACSKLMAACPSAKTSSWSLSYHRAVASPQRDVRASSVGEAGAESSSERTSRASSMAFRDDSFCGELESAARASAHSSRRHAVSAPTAGACAAAGGSCFRESRRVAGGSGAPVASKSGTEYHSPRLQTAAASGAEAEWSTSQPWRGILAVPSTAGSSAMHSGEPPLAVGAVRVPVRSACAHCAALARSPAARSRGGVWREGGARVKHGLAWIGTGERGPR
mmetsp:Transcript_425/g.1246  ORF Transcript_425/g.1246 Transcript_425/m.1246 type:complete len:232 (+) Transcript_425:39-734(+)